MSVRIMACSKHLLRGIPVHAAVDGLSLVEAELAGGLAILFGALARV